MTVCLNNILVHPLVQAIDQFQQYFKENADAEIYIASLDVDGNAKVCYVYHSDCGSTDLEFQILQSLVSQAKQLSKSIYVFSVDSDNQKLAHANYVSPTLKECGADARTWAAKVTDLVGGKVCLVPSYTDAEKLIFVQAGGKEDSAQGVGLNADKLEDALTAARDYISTIKL